MALRTMEATTVVTMELTTMEAITMEANTEVSTEVRNIVNRPKAVLILENILLNIFSESLQYIMYSQSFSS